MNLRHRVGFLALGAVLAGRGPDAWSRSQESPEGSPETRILIVGHAAFESRDYSSAVGAYSRISPVQLPVSALNRLAMSYHMLGMLREAEALYRVATVRDKAYAPPHNNLAALYYARGDFGDAESRFRDSLKYDPGNPVTESNLHAAKYARENGRPARAEIERLIGDNPLLLEGIDGEVAGVVLLIDPSVGEELRMLALRGDIFVARKMFEDAIIEYARYLEIDRYDARVRNKLGIAYQQAQRPLDAESEYRDALKLNPYFVPALNNLGSVAQARGDYLGAMEHYRRALEIDEESATVMQNVGSCFFALERYEDGLLAYIRAVQLDPSLFDRIGGGSGTLVQTMPGNGSMTNFYLAKLFANNGDWDRTMSFLYRAVEEGFDNRDMLNDPAFSGLGADDRFVRLVASLGEAS